jgi:hypothetical protein
MLFHCGAIIYRAVLLAYLGRCLPTKDLTKGKALADNMKANQLQRALEKALLLCAPTRRHQ